MRVRFGVSSFKNKKASRFAFFQFLQNNKAPSISATVPSSKFQPSSTSSSYLLSLFLFLHHFIFKLMAEEKKAGVWPTVKPFVNGGASGMLATCVIQPIDMIKVLH